MLATKDLIKFVKLEESMSLEKTETEIEEEGE